MAIAAAGTVLQVLSGTVYVTVAEITSLEFGGFEIPSVGTSHLTTTKKTYRAGVPDAGEVSGTLLFDPEDASHDLLFDLWDSPETTSWKIVTASTGAAEYDFDGFLTNLAPSFGDLDENVEADFSLKISGGVTLT